MPQTNTPVGKIAFVCVCFLLSGVVSALTSKTLFQKNFPAYCEDEHPFAKPYLLVMTMFIGEMLCLPLFYILQYLEKRKRIGEQAQNYEQLTDFDAPNGIVDSPDQSKANGNGVHLGGAPAGVRPPLYFFLILSTFDLVASSCVTVGQVWIAASIAQMLRGSMVVFTALFSWLLLARRYNYHQVGGIAVVVLGLIVVGISTVLNGDSSDYSAVQVAMGIVLTVVGSLLNAIQNVVEERLLKADNYVVQPLEVVGWEGVFGLMSSSFILLPAVANIPGSDCGVAEDTIDSLSMLSYSGVVVVLNLGYIFGIMFLNWTANIISLYLSATHRNLINGTRTVIVWIVSLFLWYVVDTQSDNKHRAGEAWTDYSLVELAGFILLIGGTVYFSHASQKAAETEKQKNLAAQLLVDDSLHNGIHVQNESN